MATASAYALVHWATRPYVLSSSNALAGFANASLVAAFLFTVYARSNAMAPDSPTGTWFGYVNTHWLAPSVLNAVGCIVECVTALALYCDAMVMGGDESIDARVP